MSKIFYKGIDVSESQAGANWSKVKNSGTDFAILRTGFGLRTEDKFLKVAVQGCKKNNIDIPAVYHFSYACSAADAEKEAEFAVSLVKKYNLPKTTIIFYDFEYGSSDYFNKQTGIKPTPATVQKMTYAFCDKVKSLGYLTGVYYNQDYFVNVYDRGKSFKPDYFRWLADLEGEPNYECDFHQYSHTGRVTGITANVDMDYALFDYRTLKYSEGTGEKMEPVEAPVLKPDSVIAKEVIQGLWGNGAERKQKLTAAGYNYDAIQALVNAALPVAKPVKKVTDEVIDAVIRGDYGNGDERKTKLEAAGYVYKEVQDEVNKKLSKVNPQKSFSSKVSPAQSHDESLSGEYVISASSLNLRFVPGLLTNSNVVKVLYNGEKVRCWGYYTQKANSKWLLIQQGSITGFVDSRYVKKV